MTTNSNSRNETELNDEELSLVVGVGGATPGMTDSWTVLQNQLTAAYARSNENPYNWGHF